MKKYLLLLVCMAFIVPSVSNAACNGNASFAEEVNLQVTTPGEYTLATYVYNTYIHQINLTYRAGMEADFSDVAFFDSDNSQLTQAFIKDYSASSWALFYVYSDLTNETWSYCYNYAGTVAEDDSFYDYFNFDDGTVQGWTNNAGAGGVSVITTGAYSGYSLKIDSQSTVGGGGNRVLSKNWTKVYVQYEDKRDENDYMQTYDLNYTGSASIDFRYHNTGYYGYAAWSNNLDVSTAYSTSTYKLVKHEIYYNGTVITYINGVKVNTENAVPVKQTYKYLWQEGNGGNNVQAYIDEFVVMPFVSGTVTYTESTTTAITINSPLNITYWNGTIYANITAENPAYPTFNLTYWIDGSMDYSNDSYVSGTEVYQALSVGMGGHNLTIDANGTLETVIFTVGGYEEGYSSYEGETIEGTEESYSLQERTNFGVIENITAGFWWNNTYRGSCTNSDNSTHSIFIKTFTIPETALYNETVDFLFNLTISWLNGTTSQVNSSTLNQISHRIVLTNCTIGAPTLTFYLFDEETDTAVYSDVETANDLYYEAINRSYGIGWDNISETNMCIYPYWATYTVEAQIFYGSGDYEPRSYFIDTEISNATQDVYLYLLNSSLTDTVYVYVKDLSGLAIEGAIVKIQRFYVGSYSYKTVAQIRTDYEGKGVAYLDVDNVYYRFIVELDGVVLREFTPSMITCAAGSTCPPYSVTLYTTPEEISEFLRVYGSISASCTWNNSTGVLTCTGSDTTGIAEEFRLTVNKFGTVTKTQECQTSTTSSGASLVCTLSSFMGNTYEYLFEVDLPTTGWQPLEAGYLDFASDVSYLYGWNGLLVVFVLIITGFFLALGNPTLAVIIPSVMVLLAFFMGMIPVTATAITGLIIVVAVIVYVVMV